MEYMWTILAIESKGKAMAYAGGPAPTIAGDGRLIREVVT
jgi:hypothetical protein